MSNVSYSAIDDGASNTSVTGRDQLILAQALGYAILAISALPEARQESSNLGDMRSLLAVLGGDSAGFFLKNAAAHLFTSPRNDNVVTLPTA